MAPDVRLAVQQVALVEALLLGRVLVRTHDVAAECLEPWSSGNIAWGCTRQHGTAGLCSTHFEAFSRLSLRQERVNGLAAFEILRAKRKVRLRAICRGGGSPGPRS